MSEDRQGREKKKIQGWEVLNQVVIISFYTVKKEKGTCHEKREPRSPRTKLGERIDQGERRQASKSSLGGGALMCRGKGDPGAKKKVL